MREVIEGTILVLVIVGLVFLFTFLAERCSEQREVPYELDGLVDTDQAMGDFPRGCRAGRDGGLLLEQLRA